MLNSSLTRMHILQRLGDPCTGYTLTTTRCTTSPQCCNGPIVNGITIIKLHEYITTPDIGDTNTMQDCTCVGEYIATKPDYHSFGPHIGLPVTSHATTAICNIALDSSFLPCLALERSVSQAA